jgi:signal recognition particle subunit SEC65
MARGSERTSSARDRRGRPGLMSIVIVPGHRPRHRGEVVVPQIAHVPLVLAIREGRRVPLRKAVDQHDLRHIETALAQFGRSAVVERAEQPVVHAPWSGYADLVVATHAAVHCLPLATAAELRRWSVAHSFNNRENRRLDPQTIRSAAH